MRRFFCLLLLGVLGCSPELPPSTGAVEKAKADWTNYVATGKAATNELEDVRQAMEEYERLQDEESALQLIGLINRLIVEPVP